MHQWHRMANDNVHARSLQFTVALMKNCNHLLVTVVNNSIVAIEIMDSSNWREETRRFGGKKFKIEIDSSIWREESACRCRYKSCQPAAAAAAHTYYP